jgi:hypothetical protein
MQFISERDEAKQWLEDNKFPIPPNLEGVYNLSRKDLSNLLGSLSFPTAEGTLAKLACLGGGPPYRTFSNRAIYDPFVGLAWAYARTSRPKRFAADGAEPSETEAAKPKIKRIALQVRPQATAAKRAAPHRSAKAGAR